MTSTEASGLTVLRSGEIFRAARAALASSDSWAAKVGVWLSSARWEIGFRPFAPDRDSLVCDCACAESTTFLSVFVLEALKGLSLEACFRASLRKVSCLEALFAGLVEGESSTGRAMATRSPSSVLRD